MKGIIASSFYYIKKIIGKDANNKLLGIQTHFQNPIIVSSDIA